MHIILHFLCFVCLRLIAHHAVEQTKQLKSAYRELKRKSPELLQGTASSLIRGDIVGQRTEPYLVEIWTSKRQIEEQRLNQTTWSRHKVTPQSAKRLKTPTRQLNRRSKRSRKRQVKTRTWTLSYLSEILLEVKNLKKQSEEFRTETKKSRTSKRKYRQQAKNGRRNSAL